MQYLHRSAIGIFSPIGGAFAQPFLRRNPCRRSPPQLSARPTITGRARPSPTAQDEPAQDPFAEPRFADEQSAQLILRDNQRSFRPLAPKAAISEGVSAR
jgi:hypothetical protein